MKTRFITIFTSILIIFLTEVRVGNAQGYVPFPMDSVYWRMNIHYHDIGCDEYVLFDYVYSGDTLISNLNYRKVYAIDATFLHVNGAIGCGGLLAFPNTYIGAVRQDTLNQKVYLYRADLPSDSLLYDFNLVAGDTLKNGLLQDQNFCSDTFFVVQTVDSVLINGSYFKRWRFQCIGDIIEGIGSTAHPFGESGGYLSCMVHNTFIYDIGPYCNYVIDVNEISRDLFTSFLIYPNPVISNFSLKKLSETKAKYFNLKVFNSINCVKQLRFKDDFEDNFKIDLSSLSKGFYFVEITDDKNAIIFKGKIIHN